MGRFYLTTPIYYVNDAPHVGHAYTTVAADAIARWHRLCGEDVLFLTGTDEHGLKVAQAAAEQGMEPGELATLNSARFAAAWEGLDIANDDFVRTTEPRHHLAAQAFLGAIRDNGHIYMGTYSGLYCVACEAYYTDAELEAGNCPIHKRPVQMMEEKNYFFALSQFQQRLLDWYSDESVVLPRTKRNEALGFIRSGLEDISITRTSLTWGVPVPWDAGHVFYVWYEALSNYLTAVGYGSDPAMFEDWWPAAHHLIGKDILRPHCVWWPAMCMAAGIEPPRQVFVHGYLLVGGEKMSKTGLTQIAPSGLVDDFGVDAVRYHLLRDIALGTDGDFSYEGMVARYNSDLANNLGNLMSRVATVVGTKCGGVGPAPRPASTARLASICGLAFDEAAAAWERFAPQDALEATWRVIGETNAELEASEPWKSAPGPEVDAVLGDALEALRIVAVLASPAMPRACAEVWRRLGLPGSPGEARLPSAAEWGGYPGGLSV
ncbi:MAG: class I tRNA ligase family protein, partial [Candidatus Dormibacteria bacterium]